MIDDSPGHRTLRKGRVSQPGQIYHLTFTIRDRAAHFALFTTARLMIRTLHDAAVIGDSQSLAWCLMPDHLHWLLQLGEQYSLSTLVQRLKSVSTRRIRQAGFADFSWAPAFHDHALRKEEDFKTVAQYIIANPVRAGLVECVGDYPHWDVVWLL